MAAVGPTPFSSMTCIGEDVKRILSDQGFVRATPVQEATIPLLAGNKDVAVDACTGSGKTLAFVLPIVEILRRRQDPLKPRQVGAVIVSPTRELARQICEVARPFVETLAVEGSSHGAGMQLLVGGTDGEADLQAARSGKCQVLVGTPGRLDDFLGRATSGGSLDLRQVEVLILDEADRLLEMGFQKDLDAIMARLPRQRRTGLFSATQTNAVKALSRAGLRNPVRVNVTVRQATDDDAQLPASQHGAPAVDDRRTPASLSLTHAQCAQDAKLPLLIAFLARQQRAKKKVIAYMLTCAEVEFVSAVFGRLCAAAGAGGLQLRCLHGRMKQPQREKTLADFLKLPAGCLLATDVAARGLDIPDVDWVVQLDPPPDPNSFVHRVGRTARMGRSGSALSLLLPHEEPYVEFLRNRKVPMSQADLTTVVDTAVLARLAAAPGPAPAADDFDELLAAATRGCGARLRALSESDRDVLERGLKAFIGHVRAYKEHHCSFIFRMDDLDLSRLAWACALLRLPRMPEVKKSKSGRTFEQSSVDPDSVRYKDKAREKLRQANMSKVQERREREREERKAKAREMEVKAAAKKLPADRRRKAQNREDLEDLDDDYRMLKKLRKGKISEREFEEAAGLVPSRAPLDSGSESDGGGESKGRGAGEADSDSDSDGSDVRNDPSVLDVEAIKRIVAGGQHGAKGGARMGEGRGVLAPKPGGRTGGKKEKQGKGKKKKAPQGVAM